MGSVILQAADERILAPNARVMIHYGYMGMAPNHTKIYQKWAEECKKLDQQMLDIYMDKIVEKHPRFQRNQLDEMCNFDTILNAQEAVNLGLADSILP
jgi:ATP-dependent protease ClpP protease subunit